MKKADVNKNMQLIRCWSEISKWIAENCKGVRKTINLNQALLYVEYGKAELMYDQDVIRGKSLYKDTTRRTLTAIVRTQTAPFEHIETLVTGWSKCKEQLITESNKLNNIYNFKV